MLKPILSLGAALCVLVSTGTASAQTLVNGEFTGQFNQTYSGPFNINVPDGWTTIATTAQEAAAWVHSDLPNSYYLALFNATGTKFSSMASTICEAGHGTGVPCNQSFNTGFQQTVTDLVAGHTYAISYWTNGAHLIDGGAGGGYAGTAMGWDVTFAGVTQQGVRAPTIQQSGQYGNTTYKPWVQATLSFVADSTSDVLAFAAKIPPQGNPDWSILALANVQITDVTPVPEPSALSLTLAGVAGLLFLRRPQRSHS